MKKIRASIRRFDDASPDIVEYVRYLEVIAGKSANTASVITAICAVFLVL